MQRLIVADIFGQTPALQAIAEVLPGATRIFDPYEAAPMAFESEEQAYRYFMDEVGLPRYTHQLSALIQAAEAPVSLLGFSVGAAAIWLLSADGTMAHRVSGSVGFYGGQIRHHVSITPAFSMQLVMPQSEPHFSVFELRQSLSNKPNVRLHQSAYLHGFMNQHSINFDPDGHAQYMQALRNVPAEQCVHQADFEMLA